jgi:uncharacterized protein
MPEKVREQAQSAAPGPAADHPTAGTGVELMSDVIAKARHEGNHTPFRRHRGSHAVAAVVTARLAAAVLLLGVGSWLSGASSTPLGGSAPAVRALAVDPADMVPVELATVGVDQASGSPVALLREPNSGAIVPILIGVNEARAILMALEEVVVPRPMTHDLMHALAQAAGLRLERVLVDELRNNTYFGMLEFRDERDGGERPPLLIDTRPSDGLALGVRARASILVAPAILQQPGRSFESLPHQAVVSALDITVVALTEPLRQALGLPDGDGVLVSATRGRAKAAGIKAGALIRSVNGHPVDSPMAYLRRVSDTQPNQLVVLRYWMDSAEHTSSLPTDVPQPGIDERPRIAL